MRCAAQVPDLAATKESSAGGNWRRADCRRQVAVEWTSGNSNAWQQPTENEENRFVRAGGRHGIRLVHGHQTAFRGPSSGDGATDCAVPSASGMRAIQICQCSQRNEYCTNVELPLAHTTHLYDGMHAGAQGGMPWFRRAPVGPFAHQTEGRLQKEVTL
jgi:hypothetical protein